MHAVCNILLESYPPSFILGMCVMTIHGACVYCFLCSHGNRLSLAEVAAAAELILQKDWEAEKMLEVGQESDEGFGGDEYDDEDGEEEDEEEEEESEAEEESMSTDHLADQSLADSGFGCTSGASPQPLSCESR